MILLLVLREKALFLFIKALWRGRERWRERKREIEIDRDREIVRER